MKRLTITYHQERADEPIFYHDLSRTVSDETDSVALAHRLLTRAYGNDYTLDSIQEDLAAAPALEALFRCLGMMAISDLRTLLMRGAKETV